MYIYMEGSLYIYIYIVALYGIEFRILIDKNLKCADNGDIKQSKSAAIFHSDNTSCFLKQDTVYWLRTRKKAASLRARYIREPTIKTR